MIDKVEAETNKMLEDDENRNKALDSLLEEIDPFMIELNEMIKTIKKVSKDYKGYDFTEDVEIEIKGRV